MTDEFAYFILDVDGADFGVVEICSCGEELKSARVLLVHGGVMDGGGADEADVDPYL